jgi:hypothetical protein
MAEQQLIDYIKKAREAGQNDDQSRDLLYKNGWTLAEVNEAIMALTRPQSEIKTVEQPKVEVKPQPQIQSQPKIETKPEIKIESQPFVQPKTEIKPEVIKQPEIKPVSVASQPAVQPQPQAQPQYRPSFEQNNMPRMGNSHMLSKIITTLIIIIVLGGAGYFTAGQYLNLPFSGFFWNFFAPKPEVVIAKMMSNMSSVKSAHTTMQWTLGVTGTDGKTSQGQVSINTNSETDALDAKNPKSSGNFTISFTNPGSASSNVSAVVSVTVINGTTYVKLNDAIIPSAIYSANGPDISKIKGKWFKIDKDSIKALSEANGQTGMINIPSYQPNNADMVKQLQSLMATENMFSVTKQLNDQTISGHNTYHYLVSVDKNKLKDLIAKIIALEIQFASQNNPGTNSGALATNMVQAVVNTFVDSIGDINMEIWVGKSDFMLYQVNLDKSIDLGKVAEAALGYVPEPEPGVDGMQLSIKLNMINSNFNKAINVQVPASSQKIEEVLLPLINTPTANASPATKQIKSDMTAISSTAGLLFNTSKSYATLCKAGALNGSVPTYGPSLITSVRDMIKQGAKNISCLSDAENYCLSARTIEGGYLCVNKNKKLGTTQCITPATVCK